jgi:transcriptional regulator with XRE-family HTH domain
MAVAGPVVRRGISLDVARLDLELARRGLSKRRFAKLACVSEVSLSRARHGRPVTEATLTKIVDALSAAPVLGIDLVQTL